MRGTHKVYMVQQNGTTMSGKKVHKNGPQPRAQKYTAQRYGTPKRYRDKVHRNGTVQQKRTATMYIKTVGYTIKVQQQGTPTRYTNKIHKQGTSKRYTKHTSKRQQKGIATGTVHQNVQQKSTAIRYTNKAHKQDTKYNIRSKTYRRTPRPLVKASSPPILATQTTLYHSYTIVKRQT